ncbi:cell envelope integrity protein TolA [Polaromonas sp.]|uniref:cell envelope integrity protein TolA n=1 Tax=Polaromonas sp. TaxID=1869339 RepID=UPI003BAB6677
MPSATDRLDFAPPRDAGSVRAFGLALLVHVLLIAALTWGVNWKRSDQSVSFEAELWSSVPQAAAPKLVEAPPPPPPEPAQKAPEVKATPPAPDVDIALEQEKKRKLLQQQKELEAQKALDKQKAEALAKKEKEKEKELKAKEEQAKRLAAQQEAKKLEAQKQARQQDADKQSQAAAQKQRQEALNRMMGLAGASGAPNASGIAQKSSGPSGSYGGKVRAKVKPNVVFTDDVAGNPTAEVEVRTTADGTIISQRLVKSSGNAAWDDAVIKAIIRTGSMPRDVDGRVPTPMILEFRPKD